MSPSVPLVAVTGQAQERLEALGVEVADLYRALANQPSLLESWIEFSTSLRRESATSRAIRELMILRLAQIHDAGYQWRDHLRMAAEAGVTDRQIEDLEGWRSSSLFDEATQSALAFTEEMVQGDVDDDTLERLADMFTPAERIELTLTAGFLLHGPARAECASLGARDRGLMLP